MAITLDHGLRFRDAMKGLGLGAVFAAGLAVALTVSLTVLEGDATAALTAEFLSAASAVGGTGHARMTLAKAKKKKRGGGAASSKSGSDDSAGSDDDAPSKAAPASSDSGDDSVKEEEQLFGPTKKKKAAPHDDSDASDSGSSGHAAIKMEDKSAGGDDKPADTVSAKASEPESGTSSTATALEFGLGARALFRNLQWTSDGRAAGLGPYSLTPGPETGLWLEFYPAAFGMTGFAANVGIYGSFNYGFGVATTLASGKDAATTFRDFQGGVKLRIPVGTFIPNVSVGYGQQVFAIAQQQATTDLPQLAYQFVRPALGTRVMFTPTIALDVTAAYLMVIDPGSGANQIRSSRFFPKATSYGIDVSASVGFRLTGTIGARAGADWRQYGLNLNPDSTTRSVAGAVDRYVVAWAGIEVVLDGSGSGAGGDDQPVKPSKRKHRHEPKPDDESSSDDDSKSDAKSEAE